MGIFNRRERQDSAASAAQVVASWAAQFVAHVTAAGTPSSATLDYTEESLRVVDQFLGDLGRGLDVRANDATDQALIDQCGAYVLETARREWGGTYLVKDDEDLFVLAVGEPDFRVIVCAMSKVRGRLTDEGDGIPFFFRVIRHAVEGRRDALVS